ncbi:MAG: hypothetical protein [Olavius algarvensis Delta 4 endosymbiont]|nr:MAG: hypothetical protein [Olavius algarvensis Delta 4 endosymbiont]
MKNQQTEPTAPSGMPIGKLIGNMALSTLKWVAIAFAIQMTAIIIGFYVESTQLPLNSAFTGGFIGTIVFLIGWILNLIVNFKDYKNTK